jgi:hypothetical protein
MVLYPRSGHNAFCGSVATDKMPIVPFCHFVPKGGYNELENLWVWGD